MRVGRDFNPRSPHGERRICTACSRRARLFQSTLPARGATARPFCRCSQIKRFQSTLPARGATGSSILPGCAQLISIHAPRTGSDIRKRGSSAAASTFQSTLPARGATSKAVGNDSRGVLISIHAPRTGSDHEPAAGYCNLRHFNPRSPHGERRPPSTLVQSCATISIHAPRTGSDVALRQQPCDRLRISIHAPRTGSDVRWDAKKYRYMRISIHAPRTGSDTDGLRGIETSTISIHAPRTGSDLILRLNRPDGDDFNPRSPHGERQVNLPTRLACKGNFNPRSPHGERPLSRFKSSGYIDISIHAPRTGSDSYEFQFLAGLYISIHAPRTGSDPAKGAQCRS